MRDRAVALLVATRCFVEAVTFASLAALVHAGTAGQGAMPVVPAVLALFGAALVLTTLLREAGTERRSTAVIVATLALGVAWGLSLPQRAPDGLALLSRAVGFGLLAEAFLWRVLSIARGALRWTDARNALPVAATAIALAVIGPWNVERGPFATLALLVVAASGLSLSLARTTEELSLVSGTAGGARLTAATSATVVVAIAALAAAALAPLAQEALGALGALLGPIVERVLYVIVLPFAYLASALIELVRPLTHDVVPQLAPGPLAGRGDDAELLRQIEASRPFVFGAVELVIVAVAALVAVVLLERMLRERRVELPRGVTLEREHADGLSLMETLRALTSRPRVRRVPPRDDGSRGAALLLLYWRLLALAERRGAGWRRDAETPREHVLRIAAAEPAWHAAAPLVSAFEDLRYGEREPDEDVLAMARGSLRALEARPRAS